MIWFACIILFVLVTVNVVGYLVSAPTYKGDKSDHFDGKKFINLGDVKANGLGDALKWARTRKPQPWTEVTNATVGETPADKIDDGIKITFVNHSTFLIQMEGINILTDPVWSERTSPVQFAGPKRMRPPGIEFNELPEIDIIVISHNHYDHLDKHTMQQLIKKYDPKILTPLGVGEYVKSIGSKHVHDLDWWQEVNLQDSVRIACVPAQHFSGRGLFDRDATLWCGYVFITPGRNVYFAGDSGYGDFFKEIRKRYGSMNISMIPIGAYLPRWFMSPIHISPDEAVMVHEDVGSGVSIAMHFGTFHLADDGQDQPIVDLEKAMADAGLSEGEFVHLGEGESYQSD